MHFANQIFLGKQQELIQGDVKISFPIDKDPNGPVALIYKAMCRVPKTKSIKALRLSKGLLRAHISKKYKGQVAEHVV